MLTLPDHLAAVQAEFLAAIRESPDDDTPRLVYADWLTERGEELGEVECPQCRGSRGEWDDGGYKYQKSRWVDCDCCHGTGTVSNGLAERAELIRVECELVRVNLTLDECAKADISAFDPQRAIPAKRQRELRERERELLLAHANRWFVADGSIDQFAPANEDWRQTFRRGFIEAVSGPFEAVQLQWDGLRSHPDVVLRRVELTTWPEDNGFGVFTSSDGYEFAPEDGEESLAPACKDFLRYEYPGHCSKPIQWVLPGEREGQASGVTHTDADWT